MTIEIRKTSDITFRALDDKKPIGFANMITRADYSFFHEGRITSIVLVDIFVKPEYRHQGIGRQLMEAAIEDARGRGFQELMTNRTSMMIRPLLRSLGFEQRDRGIYRLVL